MALLTLALVYRATRDWFDEEAALLAVAILAWNPVFVTYAKQPMSDVPATAWLTLAIVLALQRGALSALRRRPCRGRGGDHAAGVADRRRDDSVPLAARRDSIPAVRAQRACAAAVRRGHPDGDAGDVVWFAVLERLRIARGAVRVVACADQPRDLRASSLWIAFGPIWLMGVIPGLIIAPADLRWRLLTVFAAVTLPYLFYLPFDHWETLRFLLPGLAIMSALIAASFSRLGRSAPMRYVPVLFAVVLFGRSEMLLRSSSQWAIQSLEARYPLAGEWVNVNTPLDSVVMANQHSGSLRWYGKRQTIRWDFVEPERLAARPSASCNRTAQRSTSRSKATKLRCSSSGSRT